MVFNDSASETADKIQGLQTLSVPKEFLMDQGEKER
jgi:hypothetical protein